jgi:hypothetical protein
MSGRSLDMLPSYHEVNDSQMYVWTVTFRKKDVFI